MNRTHANGATPVPPVGRYRIDAERSAITITTRHLFGLGPVRATLALRDGRIRVTEPASGSTVEASAAAGSFNSGNDARDAAVLSPRLLAAAAYPSLTFISTSLEDDARPAGQDGLPSGQDAQPAGEDGRWRLRGELEVRGVRRAVEVRIASVSAHAGTLHATARLRVDRYAFGITAYRGLAARWLTVDLDIVAEAEAKAETEAEAAPRDRP